MKTIPRNSILLLVLAVPGLARGQHLDSLPAAKRDSILLEVAKETVMKYGPDYYRDHQPPRIKRLVVPEHGRATYGEKNVGRIYYSVTYPADKARELCVHDVAASVNIWADTREATSIFFGCGFGYGQLEELEQKGRIIKPVPYQEDLSRHYWDTVKRVTPWSK
jgi:hypothetical protein